MSSTIIIVLSNVQPSSQAQSGFNIPNNQSSGTPNSSLVAFQNSLSSTRDIGDNSRSNNNNNTKVVILTFGDGLKNQYTNATPILNEYGFKASYFVTCNFVGFKSRMNWQEIASLYHQGNDIGAKTLSYKILNKLSSATLNFEVGQSKTCLQDHGISNVTLFATPA